MGNEETEGFDMDDIYDSLRYGFEKNGPSSVEGYLDVWYNETDDDKLIDKIKNVKRGGWFSNSQYQATQPGFRLLCEKKKPYRKMDEICKLDNIMDAEPYVAPYTWQGKLVIYAFLFIFIILAGNEGRKILGKNMGQRRRKVIKRKKSRRTN